MEPQQELEVLWRKSVREDVALPVLLELVAVLLAVPLPRLRSVAHPMPALVELRTSLPVAV